MHELGIVKHIIKTLEEVAEENSITKIGSVTLEAGEVSGIIPEQILDCWDYFCEKHDNRQLFGDAKLKLEWTPAVTICESCQKTYETVRYGRICPYCGSGETYLLYGNQCSIKEIEAQ